MLKTIINYLGITYLSFFNTEFYGFFPKFIGNIKKTMVWETECFNKISANLNNNILTINAQNKNSFFCSDLYLIADIEHYKIIKISNQKQYEIVWNKHYADSSKYDYIKNGLRIMKFRSGWFGIFKDLIKTSTLYGSLLTKHVPEWIAEQNIIFLREFSNINVKNINYNIDNYYPDMHSGDIISILRLDGLDPLIAKAQNASAGHIVILVENNNTMWVMESTDKTSYWDKGGLQKTRLDDWIIKAKIAGYCAIHIPLKEKYRELFDNKKAFEWFQSVEGLDYGYETMLWSWIDLPKLNMPCFKDICLVDEQFKLAYSFLDKYLSSDFSKFIRYRWGKIIGLSLEESIKYNASELIYMANKKNISYQELVTKPVSDDEIYISSNGKSGPSLVCSSFVASIIKKAGLFGKYHINANEFTVNGVYQLELYKNEPTVISGNYLIEHTDIGKIPIYNNMQEKCSSVGNYIKNC